MPSTTTEITREELALILADVKTMWASLRDIAMTAPGAAGTISTRMELPQVIDMVFEQAGLASSETLERMPSDAVIAAICKWMAWDYGDKAMRADASKLYYVILNAAPQARVNVGELTATGTSQQPEGKPAVAAFSPDKQETPRTDEEVALAKKYPGTAHGLWVSAEFTRQLERELRAANAEWGDAMQRLGEALSATLPSPAVHLALKVLLNHVEPGWENCRTVVQHWLDEAQSQYVEGKQK